MKLAEALILRADVQKRMASLKERLILNAKVQEGESPSEDPQMLIRELDETTRQLIDLIQKINKTNATTFVGDRTLGDMLTDRDARQAQLNILRDFLKESSDKLRRYSATEIAIKSTVNVAEMQKTLDKFARDVRDIDAKIQEMNWLTDVA